MNGYIDSSTYIAPPPGDEPEIGNIDTTLGGEDKLSQDDFFIPVFEGELIEGTPIAIPMNMATMLDVTEVSNPESTISQRFSRKAHVAPTVGGAWGPLVGSYQLAVNVPTTIAGRIAHIGLPGDMMDEVATTRFGLSALMGLAGVAVQSIGGPLLSGLVNTAMNTLGNLTGLGGDPPSNNSSPSANTTSISGELPISRFVDMIKYVAGNFIKDPVFSAVLMQLTNVMSNVTGQYLPLLPLPITVFARMDRTKYERLVENRTLHPINTGYNLLYISDEDLKIVVMRFLSDDRTFVFASAQNRYLASIFELTASRKSRPSQGICLEEILNHTPTEKIYRLISQSKVKNTALEMKQALRGIDSG